jgi:hypothetical protein
MNTIKTWQERCSTDPTFPSSDKAMQAEIAELRAALATRATPAQPEPSESEQVNILRNALYLMLQQFTGTPSTLADSEARCTAHAALKATAIKPQPSPSSVGAAIRAMPLPEHIARADAPINETGALVSVWMNRAGTLPYDTKVYTEAQMRALLSEAAALAEQVQGQQWLPIEKAPKDGTEVFLWLQAPFNRIEKARWFDLWENWQLGEFPDAMDEYCGIGSKVPTHYMPIPAAPSIAQDGQKSEGV